MIKQLEKTGETGPWDESIVLLRKLDASWADIAERMRGGTSKMLSKPARTSTRSWKS